MSEPLLSAVEINPAGPIQRSVIWLHGLGADGHDFEPIVPGLGLPAELGVRFVFPHAPAIPITINQNFVMPAWYDIKSLDLENRADEAGVELSAQRVTALIQREIDSGVPAENILLAGFSQGGAIALHLGLRFPKRLAGIMALSTYLVCGDRVEAERSEANRDVPIFMAHGTVDPMVPIDRGQQARDALTELGYAIQWHEYAMPHAVCPQETADIGAWLRERFSAPAP